MRTSPTPVPSGPPSASSSPHEAHATAGDGVLAVLRRSSRALAALSIGLAVLASGYDRSLGSLSQGGLPSGEPPVGVVEEASAAELTPVPADASDRIVMAALTPATPSADRAEPPGAADPARSVEEMDADPRPRLSNRTGSRPTEPVLALVETGSPDAVTVAEKLADARLRPDPERAALSAAVAVARTPQPKKQVVRVATPKPAPPRVVVRKSKPTPKPVVRTAAPSIAGLGQRVVSIAMRYLGYRYTSGGVSPSTGFDCSGFTYFVYRQAGRPIPRDMPGQYATGRAISRSGLQPGDLVFFKNTYKAGLSHAGIYIGGGRMVNAQSEGTGVVTASIDSSYWGPRFLGGRRP